VRVDLDSNSFGAYQRHFPLLPAGSPVRLYNGALKSRQDVHAAVLDLDVGKRDLQQCADAIIRLRAEYLYQAGRSAQIKFNFTNGFPARYDRWRRGDRISVKGNQVSWRSGTTATPSYRDFRKYLDLVFAYAGTQSLEKELTPKSGSELAVGDVFIQGGSPGHAVLVVDRVVHIETGEVLFLLAQSYMPAQEVHVLKNPVNEKLSPWYSLAESSGELRTPEWLFSERDLRGF